MKFRHSRCKKLTVNYQSPAAFKSPPLKGWLPTQDMPTRDTLESARPLGQAAKETPARDYLDRSRCRRQNDVFESLCGPTSEAIACRVTP
mmetsp:Transcript_72812/g.170827  ORF Transcript_72812/g.170827 Transcript_72812/m.170827 type:complete len:90 (+) Transcript_72812:6-275(+)